MINIAVPTFGDRVSPRFDCAVSFLVANVEKGRISDRRILDASVWGIRQGTPADVAEATGIVADDNVVGRIHAPYDRTQRVTRRVSISINSLAKGQKNARKKQKGA